MSQFVETPTKTLPAGAALGQYLRVKIASGVLALAGDEDLDIGTMETPTFASGENGVVRLRNATGSRKVVGASSIAAGALIHAAASGKFDDAGTRVRGIALEACTGDGAIFEAVIFG